MGIKYLNSKVVHKGKIFNVRIDEIEENGVVAQREIAEHPGGVAILAVNELDEIYCVKQYRYAQKCELVELPAGKLERGEDHFLAAKRELQEETGFEAKTWKFLGEFVPTGAYVEEKIYMYMAKGLNFVGQNLDDDEYLEVLKYSKDELVNKIMRNEIRDGKTISMVLMFDKLNG